jgi:antitoxin ParD1/3/4
MEISIPPYLREFIEKQVRSGRFKTSDDVIRSALAHFAGQDELSPDEIDELKRELSVGLDQANRGEFTSFTADDVVREGRE